MYTEEEAQQKWCPMRTHYAATQACIGSTCMAWRWSYRPFKIKKVCDNPEATKESEAGLRPGHNYEFESAEDNVDGVATWWETDAAHSKRCEGYCGLAGLKGK